MAYTAATELPTLKCFQWGTIAAPNPTLNAPLKPTDTTAYFSHPPYKYDGTIITGNFPLGIKNSSGYVMTCWVAEGAVAADGLSATVVQGIRLNGLDYTTGDADLIPEDGFSSGDAISCNIPAVIESLLTEAIQGTIATNGLGFIIGDGTASNATISHLDDASTKGWLRKNVTTGKVEYSNDGSAWNSIDSATASNLLVVSGADTTPGNLSTKITLTSGTKTITSPAGDERLNLDIHGNLAALIDDVAATAAEIDSVCSGATTATATALDVVTAGPTSNASDYHTHTKIGVLSLTAGEAIDGSTTPRFLCQPSDDQISTINIHNAGTSTTALDYDFADMVDISFGDIDASTRQAQSFTATFPGATSIKVEKIRVFMQKQGAPADNVAFEVQGNNTDRPDKAVITNGTSDVIAGATLVAAEYGWVEFSWSTPPEITSGAKYWPVANRSGINDPANYYELGRYASSKYAGHGSSSYTASSGLWTAEDVKDFSMQVVLSVDYDGKIFLLDADNLVTGMNYVGTTEDNIAADAAVSVLPPYQTQDSMTSLSRGRPYFTSTTAGSYSLSSSSAVNTANMLIGSARSATEMFLKDGLKSYHVAWDELNMAEGHLGTGDISVVCGFRPTKIRVGYTIEETAIGANDGEVYFSTYVETVAHGGPHFLGLDTNEIFINGISSIATDAATTGDGEYLVPVTIHNNGFDLRTKQDATAPSGQTIRQIKIYVEGY